MRRMFSGLAILFGLTICAQAADRYTGPNYCRLANSSVLVAIENDKELTDEVVRLMTEAVNVADSERWTYSSRPAYVWASEAKVACGVAYGYLKASVRDEEFLNKCECFHQRMVRFMN